MDKKKIGVYAGCMAAVLIFIELTIYSIMRFYKYTDLTFFSIAALFGCMAINLLVLSFYVLIFKKKHIHLTITITNVVLAVSVLAYSIYNILTTTEIFGELAGLFHIFFVLPIPLIFLIINLFVYVKRKRKKK